MTEMFIQMHKIFDELIRTKISNEMPKKVPSANFYDLFSTKISIDISLERYGWHLRDLFHAFIHISSSTTTHKPDALPLLPSIYFVVGFNFGFCVILFVLYMVFYSFILDCLYYFIRGALFNIILQLFDNIR